MDDYLDGSMDTEEVFPCKGCGEVCWLFGALKTLAFCDLAREA